MNAPSLSIAEAVATGHGHCGDELLPRLQQVRYFEHEQLAEARLWVEAE